MCSLLNELNIVQDKDNIRKSKMSIRKMRQRLHGAAKEECIPFSLVTEDQLNFLMRVLESAEGRAKMRMLLRGVIEEREDFVNSIEDVMYGNVKGEDEYVHMEDSNVSRSCPIKTVSSNKDLTESLALQFPNLYEGRKLHDHNVDSKRTLPLRRVKKKKKSSLKDKIQSLEKKKKKKDHTRQTQKTTQNQKESSIQSLKEKKKTDQTEKEKLEDSANLPRGRYYTNLLLTLQICTMCTISARNNPHPLKTHATPQV